MDEKTREELVEAPKKTDKTKTKLKKKKKKNKNRQLMTAKDTKALKKKRQQAILIHAASRGVSACLTSLGETLQYVNLDGSLVGQIDED